MGLLVTQGTAKFWYPCDRGQAPLALEKHLAAWGEAVPHAAEYVTRWDGGRVAASDPVARPNPE